jgi:hypothetical protein
MRVLIHITIALKTVFSHLPSSSPCLVDLEPSRKADGEVGTISVADRARSKLQTTQQAHFENL